jgi:pimeloyl-ACP methyl ester carboxylesterase
MPKATLKSGFRLHYQRAGHGPDLVMIHGLSGNLAVWHLKILPLLWDRFRILTYDLRGHGYSDMPPTGYSPTDMAGDLAELLDVLEIERAALVGHSYGADIALYFALLYPEKVSQVVAVEAALPAMIGLRAREEWAGWTYWADVLERSGQTIPPEHRHDVDYLLRLSLQVPKKWGPLKGLPRNPEPFLRLLETTTLARDYEDVGELTIENISRIQTPVHLLYGERSAFLNTYEQLKTRLPCATASLLPRTEMGHFGPLEQPELVAEQILASIAPGRPDNGGIEAATCGVTKEAE